MANENKTEENANEILTCADIAKELKQLELFDEVKDNVKEKRTNEAVLAIKKRYGKNAILKGINFEEKSDHSM